MEDGVDSGIWWQLELVCDVVDLGNDWKGPKNLKDNLWFARGANDVWMYGWSLRNTLSPTSNYRHDRFLSAWVFMHCCARFRCCCSRF